MDTKLVCCVCNEVLKEPKQLPCNHTCCRLCLQNYCLSNSELDSFSCPECGMPLPIADPNKPLVDWVANFPIDVAATRKLDNMQWMYETKVKEKCAICLKKWKALTATKYCKACQEYYCDECGNQHWLLRASKAHRVMLVDDLENFKNDPLLRAKLTAIFSAKIKRGKSNYLRNGLSSPRARSPINGLLSPTAHSPKHGSKSPINSPARDIFLSPNHESLRKGHSTTRSPKPAVHTNNADTEDCTISDVTVLFDGCIVVSDQGNAKLKLFDHNYRLLSTTAASCWNIQTLNEYFIAGSCPRDNCVTYFSIYDNIIEEDSVVSTGKPCYGLCVVDDQLAVACAGPTVTIKLVNSKNRSKDKTIDLDKGTMSLKTPYYLTFNNHNNAFIVSDSDSRSVKCFTMEGVIVWEKSLNDGKGLEMCGSNILVARSRQNTVDILDSNGRCLKSIVSIEDGLSCTRAIAIESSDLEDAGTRLVVVDESDLIRVFSLLDPRKYIELEASSSQSQQQCSNITLSPSKDSKLCTIL